MKKTALLTLVALLALNCNGQSFDSLLRDFRKRQDTGKITVPPQWLLPYSNKLDPQPIERIIFDEVKSCRFVIDTSNVDSLYQMFQRLPKQDKMRVIAAFIR